MILLHSQFFGFVEELILSFTFKRFDSTNHQLFSSWFSLPNAVPDHLAWFSPTGNDHFYSRKGENDLP